MGSHHSHRSSRRGMSLIEVMVVIAIMLGMMAMMVGGYSAIFEVQQRDVARRLAITYQRLHDEAVMRNQSFRISYHLDSNKYVIQAGEAGALVAATPEDREAYEEHVKDKLALMSADEKAQWLHKNKQPFESMGADGRMEIELPGNAFLYGVYTPQYGRMMTRDDLEEIEEGDPQAFFTYIMSNGFSEHTLIWITDNPDRADDGWTVEVEPLSGNVRVHGELVDWEDAFGWVPDEAPELSD